MCYAGRFELVGGEDGPVSKSSCERIEPQGMGTVGSCSCSSLFPYLGASLPAPPVYNLILAPPKCK